MSFFVPKLYAAPYSSLDTLMNDQMNFFDMKLQGGTKLMVQSYFSRCRIWLYFFIFFMVQSYVFAWYDWTITFVSPCA